ncbi:hypothetical protein CNR22_07980 [Sphingobacteriaceae bacterium]|nr:hypothetical protein CNR22_07980 [Sphingobacteriaceae bacterium]
MRKFLIIFIFFSTVISAQDKLVFRNGTSRKGIISTVTKEYVFFKTNDTSAVEKIRKSKLIFMEDYRGTRYVFSENDTASSTPIKKNAKEASAFRNSISIQPLALLFGRLNLSYEHLSKDGKLGIVIPLILTYDPAFGNIYTADSTFKSVHIKGVSYITGLDLNYYLGKSDGFKLFVGPRIRYGTDMAFFNTEAYSIQTQIGMRVGRSASRVVQHLSVGYGFVRILSSNSLKTDPKQSHMWFSLNYRLGIKW